MIRPPYSCVRTSGAEKELPDAVLRPGLSYGHRRSASAPRRALVVLRTPMDPARVEKNKQYSTSRLRLPSLATGICDDCSQQLVGELGVPVATSHFSLSRLAPEGDSCECVPVISLVIWSRIRMIPLLDLASLSSGTIFLPALVASILSEYNRLAYSPSCLFVVVALSPWVG